MNAFPRNTRQLVALVAISLAGPGCDGSDPLAPLPSPTSSTVTKGEFGFTTIEVPGARFTRAFGISASGDVVGLYTDAAGVNRGFIFRSGNFTTVDYPGAAVTAVRGIGPAGEVVGSYRMPGEPAVVEHGFLRTANGAFVKVDYPGYTSTIPQRILADGTILGCRHGSDQMASMRGVVIRAGGNSETDAFASMHNGATPDLRRIAGLYMNMMVTPHRTEGYVIDNGVFSALLVPGSSVTAAWDVNPAGEVVGFYRDATGFHGFVLEAKGYVSIDVPGATETRAFGVNKDGIVVGSYITGGKNFAFVARPTR